MTVGVEPRKNAPAHLCITGITREAARARGAAKHIVGRPRAYLIDGDDPVAVGQEAIRQAGLAVDHRGRKLRKNGTALVAAVVSYPVSMREIASHPEKEETLHEWVDQTIAWARQRWGRQLRSVVLHTDEEYPHLHFFVVPEFLPTNRLDVWAIHPGIKARDAVQRAGHATSDQTRAYTAAMKALQTEFHGAVGVRFGHERGGDGRKRMERTQVMIDRRQRQRETELNVREATLIGDETQDRQNVLKLEAENAALREALAAAEATNQTLLDVIESQRIEQEALVAEMAKADDANRQHQAVMAQKDMELENRERSVGEREAEILREKIEIGQVRDVIRYVRADLALRSTRLDEERQRLFEHRVDSVAPLPEPDNDDVCVARKVA